MYMHSLKITLIYKWRILASFKTSTTVLWIRNCSHALGELAGSRRMQLHMQQRAAHGRHGHRLEIRRHIKNPTPSIAYLKTNPAKFHPDPIWNDIVRGFMKSLVPTTIRTTTRWVYGISWWSKNRKQSSKRRWTLPLSLSVPPPLCVSCCRGLLAVVYVTEIVFDESPNLWNVIVYN